MDRIRELSKTQILVIIAALAVISLIILPWMTAGSDGSSGWEIIGDAGLGSTSILLIPLAALVIAGLVFLYKTTEEKLWLYCLIASATTLIPVLWFFFWLQDYTMFIKYGIGYWINLLAAIVMVGLCAYTVYQQRQAK